MCLDPNVINNQVKGISLTEQAAEMPGSLHIFLIYSICHVLHYLESAKLSSL